MGIFGGEVECVESWKLFKKFVQIELANARTTWEGKPFQRLAFSLKQGVVRINISNIGRLKLSMRRLQPSIDGNAVGLRTALIEVVDTSGVFKGVRSGY